MMRSRIVAFTVVVAALATACGSSGKGNSVEAAQRVVSSKEEEVADAQRATTDANAAFCDSTKTYITVLDKYGKVFEDTAATVGDLKTAGTDLRQPAADVTTAAQAALDAQTELTKAQQELADARAALAAAQAQASGLTTTTQAATSTTTTTLVPPASIDRVKQAEADFEKAAEGVTDQTPLVRATAAYNSAGLALEVAWLRLFADAGCLTTEQQKQAEAALREYTVALQTGLQTAGYYTGKIDGVYGPATVDAVTKLQSAAGLPATGFVDRATATALTSAVAAKGGAVATKALAHTAAVQSTLKLAGFWTGPVDGQWTPELTDAVKAFQTQLGVPPTGAVDVATMAALEARIAEAKTPVTTVPTTTTT